jgi:hypothetical protein
MFCLIQDAAQTHSPAFMVDVAHGAALNQQLYESENIGVFESSSQSNQLVSLSWQ